MLLLRNKNALPKALPIAEVVALSDNIDLVSLFQEFAEFICDKSLVAPIIYEDCKACIDLVSGAKGQIRTKQMQSRIFRTKFF
jgi:hypothetical protein